LYNIAVRPGLRGQGIGTALLCHVIEEASVQGFGCLEVGTGTFGFQLAFYQRAGFRAEGEFLARRLGYFGCARDLGKGLLGPFPFYMFNFGYMSLRKR